MLFAAAGMAMPLMMLVAEGRWLRTGDPDALKLAKSWARAAGVFFATGAVSGTALSFEHGLLWPRFMAFAGPIVGPAFAMWRRYFPAARALAVGQIIVLLLGWAIGQFPYIVYPDVALAEAAAPPATMGFVLWSLPFGMALLLPSLWFLFAVFKGHDPAGVGR